MNSTDDRTAPGGAASVDAIDLEQIAREIGEAFDLEDDGFWQTEQ